MGNDKNQVDSRIQSGQDYDCNKDTKDKKHSHDKNKNNQDSGDCQNRNCDHGILSEVNKKYIETKEKEASILISNWINDLTKKIEFIYVNKPSELRCVDNFKLDIDKRVCDPYLSILDSEIDLVRNAYNDEEVDAINGKCFVTLRNGDECLGYWMNGKRQGKGIITGTRLENLGIKRIFGDYKDGALTGLGRIVMLDESWREGWFQHGYLHGPVKGMDNVGKLVWVGWYEAGMPIGTCWEHVEGGGWLVGRDHVNGKMFGDDIAFLYPDLSSALVGRFENGRLVSATAGYLVDASLVDGVMQPDFRKDESVEYKSWVSSSQDIACPTHQRDVYESRMVEVKQSTLAGGGEGLFARLEVGPGVIVAFYNGLRWKPGGKGLNEDTGYAIYLDMVRTREERLKSEHMDIPEKYHSSQNYSSTLGHKANHSFSPNCNFTTALHPCYGRVPALQTLVQVKAGEEFLVHYTMDMENAPDWYIMAWELFTFDEEGEEEEGDDETEGDKEYLGMVKALEMVPEEDDEKSVIQDGDASDGDEIDSKDILYDDLSTKVTKTDELATKDTEDQACNNENYDGDGLAFKEALDDDQTTKVTQTDELATIVIDTEDQACNNQNYNQDEAMINNQISNEAAHDDDVLTFKEAPTDDRATNVTQTDELATKDTREEAYYHENDTTVEEETEATINKQVLWGGVLLSEDDLCADFGLFSARWPRLNPDILEINWNMYRDGIKRRRQLYKKLNIMYDG